MTSTPRDYAQKLLFIAQRNGEVYEKVKKGHDKALSKTWRKSAECFALVLSALLNARASQGK